MLALALSPTALLVNRPPPPLHTAATGAVLIKPLSANVCVAPRLAPPTAVALALSTSLPAFGFDDFWTEFNKCVSRTDAVVPCVTHCVAAFAQAANQSQSV